MEVDEAYFDTSGLAKLILHDEEGADVAAALFEQATDVYTSWLAYPETRSAVAHAYRDGRLTETGLQEAWAHQDELWRNINLIDLSPGVARQAGDLIAQFPLSGADAVHIASALAVRAGSAITFASWDNRQVAAAEALGLLVDLSRG